MVYVTSLSYIASDSYLPFSVIIISHIDAFYYFKTRHAFYKYWIYSVKTLLHKVLVQSSSIVSKISFYNLFYSLIYSSYFKQTKVEQNKHIELSKIS